MSIATLQSCRSLKSLRRPFLNIMSSQRRTISSSAHNAATEMLAKYKGTTLIQTQLIDPHQLQKLSLMLNRRELQPGINVVQEPPKTGTPLPAGYHLVYMTPASLEDDLGADATDKTFNPPGRFTRRMWAGGSMEWKTKNCLRVGDIVEERTRLLSAIPKKSRGGHDMILVEVEKEFANSKGVALVDRRSWIFQPEDVKGPRKEAAPVQSTAPTLPYRSVVRDAATQNGFAQRHFTWSPAALFRFSALTYNAHMIHYSDPWCRDVEGFPGLVVHGPLNLINMLDLWRDEHGKAGELPSSINYRALAPLYAGTSYIIEAGRMVGVEGQENKCQVLVKSGDGVVNMKGDITSD